MATQLVGLLYQGTGNHTVEPVTRVKVRYPCEWEECGRTARQWNLGKAGRASLMKVEVVRALRLGTAGTELTNGFVLGLLGQGLFALCPVLYSLMDVGTCASSSVDYSRSQSEASL